MGTSIQDRQSNPFLRNYFPNSGEILNGSGLETAFEASNEVAQAKDKENNRELI